MLSSLASSNGRTPGWLPETSDDAAKALHLPLGVASPLWLMFAGAAGAGVAYWWMTRWARPANLEAWLGAALPAGPDAEPLAAPVLVAEAEPPHLVVGGESAPLAGAPAEAVEEAAETLAKPLEADPSRTAPEPAPFVEAARLVAPDPAPAPKKAVARPRPKAPPASDS